MKNHLKIMCVSCLLLISITTILPDAFATTPIGLSHWNGSFQLSTVDTSTGIVSYLGNTGIYSVATDESSVDIINQIYFVKGRYYGETDYRLFSIDTQTGSILDDPVFGQDFYSMEMDTTTNMLLGLSSAGSSFQLSTIDVSSGMVSSIGGDTGIYSVSMGEVTLDSINQIYFVKGKYYGETDYRLFSIDTQTGSILDDPVYSQDFWGIEYDAISDRLLGFAWSNGTQKLSAIDKNTGVISSIGDTGLYSGGSGESILDVANQVFYIQGRYSGEANYRIVSIDTQTGNVLNDPILNPQQFINMQMGSTVVPEPISSILFITGGSLLAGRRYLRREKTA